MADKQIDKQYLRKRVINAKLQESDWTQLLDSGLTAPEVAAWSAYRATIRALPLDVDPVFPAKPPSDKRDPGPE